MRYRKIKRLKRRLSFLKRKLFWLFLFFVFLFFAGIHFLFFSSFFKIKEIEVLGAESLKENVEAFAKENLFGKNIFLLNSKKFLEDLFEKFPKIKEVKISKKFPRKLEIEIRERIPVLVFCSKECYLIDEEAIAFEKTENKEIFRVEREVEINLGEKAIEKEFLSEILKIKRILEEEMKIPLEKIFLNEKIVVKTKENWEIYFSREKIDFQVAKLRALFEKEITPEKRKKLEYIELRFGNFAPYKIKD